MRGAKGEGHVNSLVGAFYWIVGCPPFPLCAIMAIGDLRSHPYLRQWDRRDSAPPPLPRPRLLETVPKWSSRLDISVGHGHHRG